MRKILCRQWLLILFILFFSPIIAFAATLSLTSPVSYQVFQRDGKNQADIVITGNYIGPQTTLEASWNGRPYETIASGVNGAFRAKLSGEPAGQGTLRVRTTDQAVSAQVPLVGVGDIFVVAGQSNAVGYGSTLNNSSHPTLKAALFGSDYQWRELKDPASDGTNRVDVGSMPGPTGGSVWPLLASYIMADQNVPVAFVPAAVSGSFLYQWVRNTGNPADPSTMYGAMLKRVQSLGSVKAVLWWQGESEAAIGTNQSSYKSQLDQLAANMAQDLGVKTVVAQIGDIRAYQDIASTKATVNLGVDPVRLAQTAAWNEGKNILAGPSLYDIDLSDQGGDKVHFKSDQDVKQAAARWWAALKTLFYGGTHGRGPRMTKAEIEAADKSKVIVTFDKNINLPSNVALGAFVVRDSSKLIAVKNIAKTAINQIELTVAGSITGAGTISLGEQFTGIGVVPTDATSFRLPAEIAVNFLLTSQARQNPVMENQSNFPTPSPILIITPTPEPAGCLTLSSDLGLGQGENAGLEAQNVAKLQTFLLNRHFLSSTPATGFFGSLTLKAVISFQRTFLSFVAANGNVGPLTRQKIHELTCH